MLTLIFNKVYNVITMEEQEEKIEQVQLEQPEEKETFWDFARFTVICVLIVIPIRLWIAQPFIVSGASMDPTFKNGDYLIIDELSYQFSGPEKNEVVVFRYPLQPNRFYIKRVVGLPGETMTIDGKKTVLEDDEYFVMGDNRNNSSDSRMWGPVQENFLIGRALVRLFPLNKIGILPGN